MMGYSDKIERIWDGLLGGTLGVVRLDTPDEQRAASLALVSQAQRTLQIFSHDLDPMIYDTPEFAAAVRQLGIRGRGSRVEFLVQNSATIVRNGHRLVNLAQKLSSVIQLRKPHADYQNYKEAFLIVDQMAVIHRPDADRYEGTLRFTAPQSARALAGFFNEAWQKSTTDPELRRLAL